tara:strand:+ start:944 stop:2488 length:1545 start_codon:yes stop_codon:yes gene_type:complete
MVYKFYFILILILPWFKGGNADFPVRYIIYSGFAICLLSLVYGNSKKFVRSINKIYFCGFIVFTLSVLLLGRNDIAKENIEISTEELKENINLHSGIGKKLLNIINNLNYITKENVYYSLLNIKNEIYYKFNSVELSDKEMINTIYRKILDNYSPYIPILNFQKFSNLLLFCTIITCLLIPFNILKVKSHKTLKRFSLFFLINASVLCLIGILDKTGIISFSSAKPLLGLWEVSDPRYYFASFSYKNHWGAFAILSIIHGTAYLVSNIKSRKYKTWSSLFIVLLLAIIFSSLFLVDSRSSILIIFFFSLCLILFVTKYRSYILIFTIIFSSLFLIIDDRSSSSSLINRTINQFSSIKEQKYPFRFLLWNDILSQINIKTFWGYGFNSYSKINPLFQSEPTVNERYIVTINAHTDFTPAIKSAHSDILQCFSELGFVTFSLIFFPILFFVLREALFGRGYYTRVLSLGCLAYIFYSLIDLPNSSFANFNCFIFTLVLIYAYSRCSLGKRSFQKSS